MLGILIRFYYMFQIRRHNDDYATVVIVYSLKRRSRVHLSYFQMTNSVATMHRCYLVSWFQLVRTNLFVRLGLRNDQEPTHP